MSDIETELGLDFSRAAHKHLAPLMNQPTSSCCTVRGARHVGQVAYRAREVAQSALQNFVGLTDRQRREAHLYRAFHHLYCAEYTMGVLADAERRGHEIALKTRMDLEHTAGLDYFDAAQDLYYASQVDPEHDLLADLDQNDRDACARIKQRPGPQAFEVAEHKVPLLPDGKGDPRLWNSWDWNERVLMKLFRLRKNIGPDGGPGTPEDLALEYEDEKIAWEYENDGAISVIFLVADA
ncbi:hypothetical protein PG997_013615 [Apiospora hydei]|uniref:Uncharacterized protein n=1 Tax=Apiospora hydei TaxID=1337664 RepID=A0ABR1V6P6_9PEZI